MKTKNTLTVVALLVIAVAILAWTRPWQPMEAPVETAAIVLYAAGKGDDVSDQAGQVRWKQKDITLIPIDGCDDHAPVEQKLQCLRNITRTYAQNNKKVAWLLADEYAGVVRAAFGADTMLQDVSAIVLLRPRETNWPQSPNEQPDVKVLTLTLATDEAAQIRQSRAVADDLRDLGVWSWFSILVPPAQQAGFTLHQHPAVAEMLAFLLFGDEATPFALQFKAEALWQKPPLNNNGYLQHQGAIRTLPVDELLFRTVRTYYESEPFFLKQWPFTQYKALDLLQLRDSLPKERRGRYATFANPKGHQYFLDLNRYGRYGPMIVFQLDDETNLYRLARFYKTRRFYSWLPEKGGPGQDDLYVEPLGAFVHFRQPLPSQYEIPRLQYTAIRYESIAFTNENPYAHLTNMSFPLYRVVSHNCIPCHSVDGVGGSAGHLHAFDLKKSEGYALPLRAYSQEVLQEFFFNQQQVADLIGVRPNFVEPEVARELMMWLQEK